MQTIPLTTVRILAGQGCWVDQRIGGEADHYSIMQWYETLGHSGRQEFWRRVQELAQTANSLNALDIPVEEEIQSLDRISSRQAALNILKNANIEIGHKPKGRPDKMTAYEALREAIDEVLDIYAE